MVFKRRENPGLAERVRNWVYPKRGWRRALEYLGHRIKRLPDSPHRIALGIGCGVMASFTPLFGFHFVVAGTLAYLFGGNILASLISTLFGNPLTFPLIATTSLNTGLWLLGRSGLEGGFDAFKGALFEAVGGLWQSLRALFGFGTSAWDRLGTFWGELFLPYLIGGIVPGLLTAGAIYLVVKPAIAAYQARRRHRILALAKMKAAG